MTVLSEAQLLEIEEWRPIPGQEGKYDVSNFGNVRSWLRRGNHATKASETPRLLRPRQTRGRAFINLLNQRGRYSNYSVATLVCAAFHGPRPEGYECAHLNGNSSDDRAVNLKWCTHAENESHKVAHGTSPVGERNGLSRLVEWQIRAIRYLVRMGVSQASVSRLFNVTRTCAWEVANQSNWVHVAGDLVPEPERDAARTEAVEWKAKAEAAQSALAAFGRDEASLAATSWKEMAERAEAACAQMRAALEAQKCRLCGDTGVWATSCSRCDDSTDDHVCNDRREACDYKSCIAKRAVLTATDAGKGWVSPSAHAEVVKERDEARAERREHWEHLCDVVDALGRRVPESAIDAAGWVRKDIGALRAQLAEVTAQLVALQSALEEAIGYVPAYADGYDGMKRALAPDAGKRLAERVRVLEEVAEAARRGWLTRVPGVAFVKIHSHRAVDLGNALNALARLDSLGEGK